MDQFAVVKVRDAGTVASAVLLETRSTMTLDVGAFVSTTLMLSVPPSVGWVLALLSNRAMPFASLSRTGIYMGVLRGLLKKGSALLMAKRRRLLCRAFSVNPSSTAVTVTVWLVPALPLVKVSVLGDTLIWPSVMRFTVTFAVGVRPRLTVKVSEARTKVSLLFPTAPPSATVVQPLLCPRFSGVKSLSSTVTAMDLVFTPS